MSLKCWHSPYFSEIYDFFHRHKRLSKEKWFLDMRPENKSSSSDFLYKDDHWWKQEYSFYHCYISVFFLWEKSGQRRKGSRILDWILFSFCLKGRRGRKAGTRNRGSGNRSPSGSGLDSFLLIVNAAGLTFCLAVLSSRVCDGEGGGGVLGRVTQG